MEFVLAQTGGRKILSEHSPGQLRAGQFLSPIGVVLGGVGVHRFIQTTMDSEISLPVTIKIECSQHDRSRHRFFENACGYRLPVVFDDARQADVERERSFIVFTTLISAVSKLIFLCASVETFVSL